GDKSDAFRRFNVEIPPKSSGEIKHVEIVKIHAVIGRDNLQAGSIGALGLCQLVYIALQQVDIVFVIRLAALIKLDAPGIVLKAAQLIHAASAEQLAQQVH